MFAKLQHCIGSPGSDGSDQTPASAHSAAGVFHFPEPRKCWPVSKPCVLSEEPLSLAWMLYHHHSTCSRKGRALWHNTLWHPEEQRSSAHVKRIPPKSVWTSERFVVVTACYCTCSSYRVEYSSHVNRYGTGNRTFGISAGVHRYFNLSVDITLAFYCFVVHTVPFPSK